MQFVGGDLVFYAVISHEADPVLNHSTIACVSWEAVKRWGGKRPGYEWWSLPVPVRSQLHC